MPRTHPDKVKPITPDEVVKVKKTIIPNEVIEAFNECIAENWSDGSANFTQKSVVEKIMEKFLAKGKDPHIKNDIFSKKWLDVEEIYAEAGWEVDYDKPGYREDYDADFTFIQE